MTFRIRHGKLISVYRKFIAVSVICHPHGLFQILPNTSRLFIQRCFSERKTVTRYLKLGPALLMTCNRNALRHLHGNRSLLGCQFQIQFLHHSGWIDFLCTYRVFDAIPVKIRFRKYLNRLRISLGFVISYNLRNNLGNCLYNLKLCLLLFIQLLILLFFFLGTGCHHKTQNKNEQQYLLSVLTQLVFLPSL